MTREKALSILNDIKEDLKETFENDPQIIRIANVIINEFELRS